MSSPNPIDEVSISKPSKKDRQQLLLSEYKQIRFGYNIRLLKNEENDENKAKCLRASERLTRWIERLEEELES